MVRLGTWLLEVEESPVGSPQPPESKAAATAKAATKSPFQSKVRVFDGIFKRCFPNVLGHASSLIGLMGYGRAGAVAKRRNGQARQATAQIRVVRGFLRARRDIERE